MIFSFGSHSNKHEYIEIDVLRYEREPVGEYHDDSWLNAKISVGVGGFRGKMDVSLMSYELKGFLESLQALYKNLKGEAVLETMEDQIELKLKGDGKGHIELIGRILDQAGIGNCLNFSLRFDQTELFNSICRLEDVVNKFPIRS